jgi:uncharacterized protein HemY
MSNIKVVCTNPEAMNLQVTAEFSIGEWKEMLKLTDKIEYYHALADFARAIRDAIQAIETREGVTMKLPGETPGRMMA